MKKSKKSKKCKVATKVDLAFSKAKEIIEELKVIRNDQTLIEEEDDVPTEYEREVSGARS